MKAPTMLTFDFDESMERYEYYDLTKRYRGTKHEYVLKDTMVKIFEEFANHLGYLMTEQNVEAYINQALEKQKEGK